MRVHVLHAVLLRLLAWNSGGDAGWDIGCMGVRVSEALLVQASTQGHPRGWRERVVIISIIISSIFVSGCLVCI